MKLDFCNDQPGRLLAVCVISPILLYKGNMYNDYFILLFALVLFFWDLYWLCTSKPNVSKGKRRKRRKY